MRRTAIITGVLCVAALSTGCTRAIREGLGAWRGGKGVTVVVEPIRAPLVEFGDFEVVSFEDRTGTGAPPELQRLFRQQVQQMLASEGIPGPNAGDKTLTIEGVLLFYEPPEGTISEAASPLEEIVARVRLKDGGRLVAEANCVGRSTTTVNSGVDSKAQGLAKAVVGWIKDSYPEHQRADPKRAKKERERAAKVAADREKASREVSSSWYP